jgi:hypothetical protein
VRVPAEAAHGDAQATLSFRDRKDIPPVTLEFEVK